MAKYVVGVDPDSNKHGIALYVDGVLTELKCLTLPELAHLLTFYEEYRTATWHIENVAATKSVWHKGGNTTAVNVGKCIQAQLELEKFLEYHRVKFVRHKVSRCWKKDKKQFELATKWQGRSNEDTRSAAYFGFLGLRK